MRNRRRARSKSEQVRRQQSTWTINFVTSLSRWTPPWLPSAFCEIWLVTVTALLLSFIRVRSGAKFGGLSCSRSRAQSVRLPFFLTELYSILSAPCRHQRKTWAFHREKACENYRVRNCKRRREGGVGKARFYGKKDNALSKRVNCSSKYRGYGLLCAQIRLN